MGENRLHTLLILLLITLTAYSVVVRVQLYSLEVTLWYDEGLLITNILSQDLGELMSNPLNTGDGAQSAPLFFMAAVKLFSVVFGLSEASVRVFSFVVCMLMLAAVYFLMRKALGQNALLSWLAVTLAATLPTFVRYSNEMKPYMSDACFAVVVLLLYCLMRSGRLRLFVYAAFCAVIVFFSTPSIFFIAAVFIVEFLRNLKNRDYRAARCVVFAGLIAVCAFLFHYLYWLRPTATDWWMNNFWYDNRFRMPFSIEAIKRDMAFTTEYLLPFGNLKYLFVPFGLAGYLISLAKRNIYSAATGLAFLLLLAASAVGKYPIISRLWLFTYAFCIIYAVYFIAHLRVHIEDRPRAARLVTAIAAVGFSAVLLAGNADLRHYATPGYTDEIYPGMSVNPLIAYVEERIEDGETLYSFETATPVLWFKNGYQNAKIGETEKDNIIFGTDSMSHDFYSIVGAGEVYVMYNRGYIPFSRDYRINGMNWDLGTRGYLDRLLEINYTPLYWFTDSLEDLKTSAEISLTEGTDEYQAFVHVKNTGETIMETRVSAEERALTGPVRIVAKLYKGTSLMDERDLGELPAPLLPAEETDVPVDIGATGGADRIVIDLVSEGRFVFSDIGMSTVELEY